MKAFFSYFFCCRTDNESTMPILREENCVGGAGSKYVRRQKRDIGYSKSVGHVQWQPVLSAISEDGVLHAPVSDCQPNRDVRRKKISSKEKAMKKSRSTNTGNLYSWRSLLENSSMSMPSPFMFG